MYYLGKIATKLKKILTLLEVWAFVLFCLFFLFCFDEWTFSVSVFCLQVDECTRCMCWAPELEWRLAGCEPPRWRESNPGPLQKSVLWTTESSSIKPLVLMFETGSSLWSSVCFELGTWVYECEFEACMPSHTCGCQRTICRALPALTIVFLKFTGK